MTTPLIWREVRDMPNEIVPGWPVEQTSWIILTGLENFIEFVQACVQLPKKAVLACWNFQKRLFLLPFVCLHKIYCKFVGIAKPFLPKIIIERATPSQILTGQRNPTPERIIEACKEIRTSAIKSISTKSFRYRQPPSHVSDYRHQLDKWRIESEKRTEELYKIGKEDKELMKAVASGLRHLKVLKSRRDLMHSYYNKNISTMINDGTATGEKLLSMKNSIKVADAAILEKRNTCLDMLNRCQLDDVSDSGYTSPVKTDPFQSLDEDLNPPAENMQKVLSIVTEENSLLRSQLTNTVKNLEDILKVSMNINNEVVLLNEKLSKMNNFNEELSDLQYKLDEELTNVIVCAKTSLLLIG
ncbi:hypothetical protein JTE90_029279 [Oedothorax gibbosus]|uniref:Uncharacterized protein n=1 Tax=Oedothorax gibbosus TaxID=931172 RepID=A0AAV6U6I6_9ARAC|nr:hypothetical protein JTE90_029279 [Oedothorax gibbosus]